jgi:hypothetical protein
MFKLDLVMNRVILKALLGAVAVGCLVTGCGAESGGEDVSSRQVEGSAEVTKAAFVKEADAVCKKTDETQTAGLKTYVAQNPKAQSSKAGQNKMVLAVGLPPIQTEADELVKLDVPEGDEEQITAIIKGIDKAVEEGEDDPGSLLTASGGPFAAVNKLADAYGFKVCNNAL